MTPYTELEIALLAFVREVDKNSARMFGTAPMLTDDSDEQIAEEIRIWYSIKPREES